MTDKPDSAGEKVRRQVMGDEFVDRVLSGADEFSRPLQDYINDHCWGGVWARDTLPLKTRSMITVAMLAALRAPNELKGHIRGALRNGCSVEEIREILLHAAPYIGAPAVQEAFRAAREVLDSTP